MPVRSREYTAWAEFRYQIRLWTRLSEDAARVEGISPQHHQLLLAIRGFPGREDPVIADLAERLQLRHHSVVGLIDRAEADGLVERQPSGAGRSVAILLTPEGEAVLDRISARLRPSLGGAAGGLIDSLSTLLDAAQPRRRPAARTTKRAAR